MTRSFDATRYLWRVNSSRNLIACGSIDEAWSEYLLPWFRSAGGTAWRSPFPTAVVTPSRAHAVQLIRRLSQEKVALFNVRFWSPGDLWRHLAAALHVGVTIAEDEDLRLIARSAAARVAKQFPDDVSVRTLAKAPDPLLELLRILEAGGWGTEEVEGESFRLVAQSMRSVLKDAEAETLSRRYFEMEGSTPTVAFESLAVVGFDAAHFAEYPLLKAAVRHANSSLVVVPNSTSRAETLDLIWAGSWEALCGEVILCEEAAAGPMAQVCAAFDDGAAKAGACSTSPISFAWTRDDVMQSQAIAREVARLVAAGAEHLAVIVPTVGPLSREISLNLAEAKLPHYCSLSPVTMAADERAWTALLDLLADPTIARMRAFIALYPIPKAMCACGHDELNSALTKAAEEWLLSNIGALGTLLADDRPDVSQFLLSWPKLPEDAEVSKFAEQVIALGDRLEMPMLGARLRVAIARLGRLAAITTAGDAFCEWARSAVTDPRHAPPDDSAHPAAKIHVLRLHEAVGNEWDHVIFAGQNEGIFPAPERQSGVFSEETLDRLNAQVKVLNGEATEAGYAGDGQTVIRPGKSLCLGPAARRSLDVRNFLRVLNSCDRATMFLSQRDLIRPGAPLQPGAFLTRVYFLVGGSHLTAEMGSQMPYALPLVAEVAPEPDAAATGLAYAARRDASQPSGIFDYCLAESPSWAIKMSASAWARAVRSPAIQWMNAFVGVSCQRPQEDATWNKPLGIWVHGWLGGVTGKGFVENPGKEWEMRTTTVAEAFLSKAIRAQQSAGETLPLWWRNLWNQAFARALSFARSLSTVQLQWVASELSLKSKSFAPQPGLALPCGGRLDMVFSDRKPPTDDDFDGAKLLLLDFKTGADKPLSPDRMQRGEGVQLGLYGIRAALAGAAETDICLLKPGDEIRAQMTAKQAEELREIWTLFAKMLTSGRFGQGEPVRSDYGISAKFPLATLCVDQEVMDARRQRLLLSFG